MDCTGLEMTDVFFSGAARALGSGLLIATLAGCGGGGGGSASPAPTSPVATYGVGGSIVGSSGAVVLQNNGGDDYSVAASGNFTFPTALASGSQYNVSVLTQPAGQTCGVSNGSGTVGQANVSNVVVNCTTNTYRVGGSVAGLSGSVVLQDNGGDNLAVLASGNFTFPTLVANGNPYKVSVLTQPAGQSCSVSNGSGTINLANVSNVGVNCATNTYTVGGSVSGLSGNVVLQDNGGDTLHISGNGSFTFPTAVARGSPYSVSVLTQPTGQSCSVSHGTGTVNLANVSDVSVSCAANTYSVGGNISGLSGSVVLRDNGGDDLTVSANGPFQFSTAVAYGNPYGVTVLTQPVGQTCSVASGSGTVTASVSNVAVSCAAPLTLTLPTRAIGPGQLAVVVNTNDPLSQQVASYYQQKRPAVSLIQVALATGSDTISSANFATLKAAVDAQLSSGIQATLLTWVQPSRVVGPTCTMSITSAMTFGFDAKYCQTGGATTAASIYFNTESALPWQDLGLRPSMMLGATTYAKAQTLIDRGVSADASYPAGDGYLLRTSDVNRSVRYPDYTGLPALWSGALSLNYIDNSAGLASDSISNKANVLFYFTGLATVPNLSSITFRPGAIGDTLTSFGGVLPAGNGQMPITAWLDAGATASYGTVEEPYNYTQKFSQASVLIDQYYRGATLIEAYWKSVAWPGEGLFVGEPLAQPYKDTPSFAISAGQYAIATRTMRPGATYSLQYHTTPSSNWVTLKSFSVTRAQAQTVTAPLPPAAATQIRWQGPCPDNAAKQCTLAASN